MNAQTKIEVPTGLDLLRQPFPANLISKLPKPTKAQTDAVKADFKKGVRCKDCGAWHHPEVVHLDYVGHAALTTRLLDADPSWSWEPAAFDEAGLPAFDRSGGLWIKLTVCGVTRLGYGHAAAKQTQDPGAREKEVIGDALRNAAMRFGAALDLWHKGDLHAHEAEEDDGEQAATPRADPTRPAGPALITDDQFGIINALLKTTNVSLAKVLDKARVQDLNQMTEVQATELIDSLNGIIAKRAATKPPVEPVIDDEVVY